MKEKNPSKETKLANCPFCGESELISLFEGLACYFVECNNCETTGPKKSDFNSALNSWNKFKRGFMKNLQELKDATYAQTSNMGEGERLILNALILLIEKIPSIEVGATPPSLLVPQEQTTAPQQVVEQSKPDSVEKKKAGRPKKDSPSLENPPANKTIIDDEF